MIASGSLVGFLLVFVVCTWSASAIATLGLSLARERLRAAGPAAEKRAAALSLIAPLVVGGIVTLSLAGFSVFPAVLGATDHCESHGHHLHLCLQHGGAWASEPWAMFLAASMGVFVVVRLVHLGATLVSGRRRLRVIARSSTCVHEGEIPVFCAPSRRAFCFVAGVFRSRIFVASSLWDRLDSSQRDAMIGHERVHAERGDVLQAQVLSLCEIFGAPLLAQRFRRTWGDASERLCDRLAADRMGDPTSIADALLSWARCPRLGVGLSFLPHDDSLEERVIAVLSQRSAGDRVARRIAAGAFALTTVAALVTVVLADPLHHALETLFGLV